MQTQAQVALTRLKSRLPRSDNELARFINNDDEEKEEQTYELNKQQIVEEEKKFVHFWRGVRRGVEATNTVSNQYASSSLAKGEGIVVLHKHHRVIPPNHPLKIAWDLSMAVLVIYSVISIPFHIGFDVESSKAEDIVDTFITACFAVDIALSLNTAFLNSRTEKLVFDRRQIVEYYLRFWFWVDLFATVPFDSVLSAAVSGKILVTIRLVRVLRMVRLVKLYRIFKGDNKLESSVNPGLFSLLVLLVQLFIIAHILACFWHYMAISDLTNEYSETWLTYFSFADQSVTERYVASLYYIIVTMLTVGYGDIRPTNEPERVYAIATMLIGGVVFGALISQVTSLIDKRNPQAKAFAASMGDFKVFLSTTGLPLPVQHRAKEAYAYHLTKKSAFGESGILDELPPILLKELVMEIYNEDIYAVELLAGAIDHNSTFVVAIMRHARPFQVHANDAVVVEGDICNDLFFVKRGLVSFEPYRRLLPRKSNSDSWMRRPSVSTRVSSLTAGSRERASSRGSLVMADASELPSEGLDPELTQRGGKQRDNVVGFITDGNFFGDAEMVNNSTALATYRAVNHTQLLAISHKAFKNALAESFNMSEKFDQFVKERAASLLRVLHQELSEPPPSRKIGRLRRASSLSRTRAVSMSFNFGGSPGKRRSVVDELDNNREIWVDGRVVRAHELVNMNLDRKKSSHLIRVLDISEDGRRLVEGEKPRAILGERHLLHPAGSYKIAWDLFVGILILYSVLVVPVEISFNGPAYPASWAVDIVVNVFFFVDMAVSFVTAYDSREHDALVVHPPAIALNYLRGWFSIDFFSTVPFDQIVGALSTTSTNLAFTKLLKVLRLARLLKLTRILKLGVYLELIEESCGVSPAVFQLLALLFQVFFIAHLIACLWWGASASFPAQETGPYIAPWFAQRSFVNGKLEGTHIIARYLVSVYYTFTTITTVGYGDIFPQSAYERTLAILIVLVGASIFGYTLANVSAAVNAVSGNNNSSKERLVEIVEYLKEKNCTPAVGARVLSHFQRKFGETSFDLSRVSECLPPHLSTVVLSAVHARRMQHIPIFRFIHKKSVQIYLFSYLQPSFLEQGDYIVKQGEPVESIHFMVSGEAVVFCRLGDVPALMRSGGGAKRPQVGRRPSLFQRLAGTPVGMQSSSQAPVPLATPRTGKLRIDVDADPVLMSIPIDTGRSSGRPPGPPNTTTPAGIKSARRRSTIFNFANAKLDMDDLFQHVDKPLASLTDREWGELGLAFMGPLCEGEFVGHRDFMKKHAVHSYSVKAGSPCTVFVLTKTEMNKLIRLEPTVGAQLQAALVQAIRAQSGQMDKKHRRRLRAIFLSDIRSQFMASGRRQPKLPKDPTASPGASSRPAVQRAAPSSTRSESSSSLLEERAASSKFLLQDKSKVSYDSDEEKRANATVPPRPTLTQRFSTTTSLFSTSRSGPSREASLGAGLLPLPSNLTRHASATSRALAPEEATLLVDAAAPESWTQAAWRVLLKMRDLVVGAAAADKPPRGRSCSYSDFENHCLREAQRARPPLRRRQSFPSLDNALWKRRINKL